MHRFDSGRRLRSGDGRSGAAGRFGGRGVASEARSLSGSEVPDDAKFQPVRQVSRKFTDDILVHSL